MQKGRLVSVFARLLLCLVMPIQMSVTRNHGQYSTALVRIVRNNTNLAIVMNENAPLVFLLLGAFSIPGILFYYVQAHRPASQSVTKLLILAYILMTPFAISFFSSLILQLLAMASAYELVSMVEYTLVTVMTLSSWSTAFLLVIPFLMRQVRPHNISMSQDRNVSTSLSPQDMIATLLGICVFIMPIAVIQIFMLGSRDNIANWVMVSSLWTCQVIPEGGNVAIYFNSVTSVLYLFTPILVGFNTLFAYYVVRYLCHRTSRRKCIQVGLLSALGTTLTVLIPELFSATLLIPAPMMFLIGAVVVFVAKPVDVVDDLCDDVPHEMWFHDRRSGEELAMGEAIRVPLRYVLYSKVKGPRRQRHKHKRIDFGEAPIEESRDTSEPDIDV